MTIARIEKKLANLPQNPGVYFFYDKNGRILYIGKASVLKRRVSSYFQKVSFRDSKTTQLIGYIADLDWTTTGSEIEALFLEAELIKRYKPPYNLRERDDKNFIYIKITAEEFPRVMLVRRPSDDGARYFGPFIFGNDIRRALRFLRRIFPYFTDSKIAQKSALEHQIGLAPKPDVSSRDYKRNIRHLTMLLEGKSNQLKKRLKSDMEKASRAKDYEAAKKYRDQLLALDSLGQRVIFGGEESIDVAMDQALSGLTDLLGLKRLPRRIEAYDISNFAGQDAVASMVIFIDGLPYQAGYRKFKMRTTGPNDFAMMREVIKRRFSKENDSWPRPDLVIVDGGKGQLSAALAAMSDLGVDLPTIGLAKRLEQIVLSHDGAFKLISLPLDSKIIQLLQRIRDEAHRFAISYHMSLRVKRVHSSSLDQIPGVGPMTRRKLLRAFGSVAKVKKASEAELSEVVGSKAKVIKEHIS